MPLAPHTIGEVFSFRAYFLPAVSFTAIPITVFLDSQAGSRIILRYLNSGTDGILDADTLGVMFTKNAAWSIANFIPSLYEVRICIGVSLHQYEVSKPCTTLSVSLPTNGALYP